MSLFLSLKIPQKCSVESAAWDASLADVPEWNLPSSEQSEQSWQTQVVCLPTQVVCLPCEEIHGKTRVSGQNCVDATSSPIDLNKCV